MYGYSCNIVSVPYWGFFLLNIEIEKFKQTVRIVSVPYWGFFLLNVGIVRAGKSGEVDCFRPLLGLFFIECVYI